MIEMADVKLNRIKEEAGDFTAEAIRRLIDSIAELANVQAFNEETLGLWEDQPFAAGNFAGNGSMTWTVASADQTLLQYSLRRNVFHYRGHIQTSSVGGTLGVQLQLTLPVGLTVKSTSANIPGVVYSDAGGARAAGLCVLSKGANYIGIRKMDSTNWSAATDTTEVFFDVTFEVE